MSIEATVEIRGVGELQQKLLALAAEYPKRVERAARAEFGIEMRESMKRTPKATHALEQSHRLEVEASRDGVTATIIVGEGLDYAIPVHEKLEVHHPNGQAKFLESTILESYQYMAARLAARLRIE